MTALEVSQAKEALAFTIGRSKIKWECAKFRAQSNKVVVERLVAAQEGGKPFMEGVNVKSRVVEPETPVNVL